MTYRQRFERLREINNDIDKDLQEIFRLKELATSTTIDYEKDNVQSSGDKDLVGKIVGMIVDIEARIDEKVDGLVREKKELTFILNQVKNPMYKDILYQYYFLNRKTKHIVTELKYTYPKKNIDADKVWLYRKRGLEILDMLCSENKNTKYCG